MAQQHRYPGSDLLCIYIVTFFDVFPFIIKTDVVTDEEGIPDGWLGMDIGPKSRQTFGSVIASAKTVLWNGPMGVFEMAPFEEGTRSVLDAVVSATKKGCMTIAGGGDTATAVEKWNSVEALGHVSTGGGASLELLEGKGPTQIRMHACLHSSVLV